MPVPKDKQKLYGRIIGHMINLGKGKKKAKAIADAATEAGSAHKAKKKG